VHICKYLDILPSNTMYSNIDSNCWGSEIFGLEINGRCNNDYDRVTGMNSGEGSSFDPEFNLNW